MAETVRQCSFTGLLSIYVSGGNGVRLSPQARQILGSFSDGTGDSQCTKVAVFEDADGAATTYDLDGLTIIGESTAGVTKLKGLVLVNKGSVDVVIGGGDFETLFSASGDKLICRGGVGNAVVLMAPTNGYAIVASTGDGLLITGTTASTYDLYLIMS